MGLRWEEYLHHSEVTIFWDFQLLKWTGRGDPRTFGREGSQPCTLWWYRGVEGWDVGRWGLGHVMLKTGKTQICEICVVWTRPQHFVVSICFNGTVGAFLLHISRIPCSCSAPNLRLMTGT